MAGEIDKRFGAFIRTLRLMRRWSQEALAKEAGIDRSFQGRIERGEVGVSLVMVESMAIALKLSPAQLLLLMENGKH